MRNPVPAFAALAACLAACSPGSGVGAARAEQACSGLAAGAVGGPISLVTEDGRAVTEADFKGRKSLVFFGYAYCPDFCPLTLYALGSALQQLPKGAATPRTILISVDPERDTPETLGVYIRNNGFPKDIVALTGSPEALHAAAKQFGPDFTREESPAGQGGYVVSHGTIIYLMDENWKLEAFFRHDERPSSIAACIAALG
jgi:protein SCO1